MTRDRDDFQRDYIVKAVPPPFSIDVFNEPLWSATPHGHQITSFDSIGAIYTPSLATEGNLNRKDNDLDWLSNPFIQTCAAWTINLAGSISASVTNIVYNADVAATATPIESSITYDCHYAQCSNTDAVANRLIDETPH